MTTNTGYNALKLDDRTSVFHRKLSDLPVSFFPARLALGGWKQRPNHVLVRERNHLTASSSLSEVPSSSGRSCNSKFSNPRTSDL
eukprot:2377692-Amphidinium_carterae.1